MSQKLVISWVSHDPCPTCLYMSVGLTLIAMVGFYHMICGKIIFLCIMFVFHVPFSFKKTKNFDFLLPPGKNLTDEARI